MEIREAERGDVEGVREVARRSWETDYPTILSRETIDETVEEWYAPEQLAFDIESDDAHVIIAVEEEGTIGFAHAISEGESGTLLRLYIDPERREEGIGTRLVKTTCEILAEEGCERIEAMVLEANEPGNSFYRTYGFSPERESETMIGKERHDEIVYALTL